MKPTKTQLFRNTAFMALALGSVVFVTSCKKDSSFSKSNTDLNTSDVIASDDSAVIQTAAARVVGKAPIIKTGADQTLNYPTSSTTLDGSGSYDPDGSIRSYRWTKEVGNGGTIVSPSSARTSITGLSTGWYRFRLKITDNSGNVVSDTVRVTIVGGGGSNPSNQAPVVNVGSNLTITLPVSSVNLTGSATDADGTIASYLWTKTSGGAAVIVSPNAASTSVTGLVAGTYVFNLKATDNAGASSNKSVTVTVNNSTSTPPATGYTLTFSSGFDTQADMLYGGNGQYGNGTISTSTYVTGPGSFYSRPSNVSSGTRSEVQYNGSAQNNTEGAVEYDVRYEVIIPDNGHSLQWHPNTGGGSASPGLWHVGGKFQWMNWKDGGNTAHTTGVTIQTNKWYHMRVEYKFGSAGYLRHYIDGVLVCSWTGQVGDGSGQYLKVGYNGWDSNSASSRIYYDNLKVYSKS